MVLLSGEVIKVDFIELFHLIVNILEILVNLIESSYCLRVLIGTLKK